MNSFAGPSTQRFTRNRVIKPGYIGSGRLLTTFIMDYNPENKFSPQRVSIGSESKFNVLIFDLNAFRLGVINSYRESHFDLNCWGSIIFAGLNLLTHGGKDLNLQRVEPVHSLILAGDFNIENVFFGRGANAQRTKKSVGLIYILEKFDLIPVSDEPTWNYNSIDYICYSNLKLTTPSIRFDNLVNNSDHKPVYCTFEIDNQRPKKLNEIVRCTSLGNNETGFEQRTDY